MTDKLEPAQAHVWRSDHGWDDNLAYLESVWAQANDAVNAVHNTQGQPFIDELAVLMPKEVIPDFINDAVSRGWVYFNNSLDMVRAEPFGAVYGVQYHFLRHPEHPWRFELMRKNHGASPLHDALLANVNDGFPVVHASFKPYTGETELAYREAKSWLAADGYAQAQECTSTYGRFGYWRKPGPDNDRAFYLKPRVNLRDGGRGL